MRKLGMLLVLVSSSIFAQEIESVLPKALGVFPQVRDFAMTANRDEIYFTVESYKKEYSFIAYIKKRNQQWTAPAVVAFSGMYKDLEPFLAPNGLRLYFASNRVDNQSIETKKDIDIWYVERATLQSDWSKPKNVGPVINTSANEYYPSVTNTGDLFFTAAYKDAKGKEDIYVSRMVDGAYTKPVSLGTGVNSEKYEFNAFVAPDESFIIFTSYGRKDDLGRGDLYISYKGSDATWMPAKHLKAGINSTDIDYCPFVDMNSKTLYFTSARNALKTSFPKKKNIQELTKILKFEANGLGRLYKTSMTNLVERKRD